MPPNAQSANAIDLHEMTFGQVAKSFGLQENTTDFLGHTVAFCTDDSFVKLRAYDVMLKIGLYLHSVGAYGDTPFI